MSKSPEPTAGRLERLADEELMAVVDRKDPAAFEVLYDLRDADGDRAVGVPTFPVVHGPAVSATIVRSLAWGSIASLLAARAAGVVLTRELLMIAAPLAQLGFLRYRGPDKITRADCIGITWGGAALLLVYLAGTAAWTRAGLPMNF